MWLMAKSVKLCLIFQVGSGHSVKEHNEDDLLQNMSHFQKWLKEIFTGDIHWVI